MQGRGGFGVGRRGRAWVVLSLACVACVATLAGEARTETSDPAERAASPGSGSSSVPVDETTPSDRSRRVENVETVTVRAQGREEPLEKVPVSITAFSRRQIELNQIEGLPDYFRLTPNVSFANNGNRSRTQIAIRGVSNIGGRSNSQGVYVDGFNVAPSSSTRTFDPDLIDVESIEVLRGPQGTFFGRNSTGGAISIRSVKPGPGYAASVEGEYARFGTARGRGSVNVPLIENALFLRGAGYYDRSEGWIDNIGPAGGGSDHEAWGSRMALRFRPTEDFTWDLSASYNRRDQGANNSVLRDEDLGLPDPPWEVSTDVDESSLNRGWVLVSNLSWDLGPATLTSITGYIDNKYDEVADRDQTAERRIRQEQGNDLRSASQELQLETRLFDRVNLILGSMYSWDELSTRGVIDRLDTDATFSTALDEETRSWAVFGDAVWRVHPMLDLTFGWRYTEVEYERDDVDQTIIPGFSDIQRAGDTTNFDDFSYRAVLTIRWSEEIQTYFSHATAFKNGGSNGSVPPGIPASFGSEKIKSFELGTKMRLFDGRLQLNAAAFYYDWDDLQVFSVAFAGDNISRVVQNASEARTFGGEIEATAVPIAGLELTFGVGYLDAEFEDFTNAQLPDAPPGETVDLSGETVPFAPEWTLNATGQYTFPLPFDSLPWIGDVDAFVRAEWSYIDKSFFSPVGSFLEARGNRAFVIPSYQVVNLRAGFETPRLRVVGFVENLADENFFTGLRANFSGIIGDERVDPNPRIYGVRVTGKF